MKGAAADTAGTFYLRWPVFLSSTLPTPSARSGVGIDPALFFFVVVVAAALFFFFLSFLLFLLGFLLLITFHILLLALRSLLLLSDGCGISPMPEIPSAHGRKFTKHPRHAHPEKSLLRGAPAGSPPAGSPHHVVSQPAPPHYSVRERLRHSQKGRPEFAGANDPDTMIAAAASGVGMELPYFGLAKDFWEPEISSVIG